MTRKRGGGVGRIGGRGRSVDRKGPSSGPDRKRRDDSEERDRILARLEGVEPDGLVVCMYGSHADVAFDDGTVRFCLLAPKVHKLFGLCVGDRVYTKRGATEEERIIRARALRRTELRRKRGEEDRVGHVIAANLDRMLITVALHEPPLRTGAIDRYLVLASVLGVEPVLVLTKIDQAPEDHPGWQVLEPYRELGVPIFPTSAETGEGLPELAAFLTGRVGVFAGHSGVGKSSICLAMGLVDAPEAGAMSRVRGRVRGRHTTSIAKLLAMPGGGWVVDTPGVRAIGLVDITRRDVGVHFAEFEPFAERCEWADCLHWTEEGCAVREAVDDGELPEARYAGYVRLLEALDE